MKTDTALLQLLYLLPERLQYGLLEHMRNTIK
jgi:hypothetical protein